MRKAVLLAMVLFAAMSAALAKNDTPPGIDAGQNHGLPVILSFDTMYGVDGPLLGETNAIRGVIGDEAPWTVAHFIKGRLDKSGRLQILVRGLVFADDPLVDPGLIGKNDEPFYRGLVSCLTEDAQGGISPASVVTDGFPASVDGNSFIDQTLELPNPCIAPIVFVMAGSEDKWFAVTGFESKSESATKHR
jgi:hypothetical protein